MNNANVSWLEWLEQMKRMDIIQTRAFNRYVNKAFETERSN